MTLSRTSNTHEATAAGPLAGRVAIVTGGGRGLGEATCEMLARNGATVAVADLRDEAAESVAARLRDTTGRDHAAFGFDVADVLDAERCLHRIAERYGGLDIVINNAGTDVTLPVEELTVDAFDQVLATNLRGPFVVSRAVFPLMRARGGGNIVNILSTAARRAWANAAAYHASKWGLLGLSHALHVEGRECGIAVTAVIAGGMRTPFLLDRFPNIDLHTLQDPANVAETIRFVLLQPPGTVIPEVTVLPVHETSWP